MGSVEPKPVFRQRRKTEQNSIVKKMKKRILIVCLLLLSVCSVLFLYHFRVETDSRTQQPVDSPSFSYELFDQVLQEHVDEAGRVNYTKLTAHPEKLEAYLDLLAFADPEELSYNERLTFWINAYNAFVIKGVVNHYPITSVRKVKLFNGFFFRLKFQVAGKMYTLNQIEHDIIRTEFVDPRVHFVLVCASSSCPSLETVLFLPIPLRNVLRRQPLALFRILRRCGLTDRNAPSTSRKSSNGMTMILRKVTTA